MRPLNQTMQESTCRRRTEVKRAACICPIEFYMTWSGGEKGPGPLSSIITGGANFTGVGVRS